MYLNFTLNGRFFLYIYVFTVEPIAISGVDCSSEIKNGKIRDGKSASLTVKVEGDNPVYQWFRASHMNNVAEPLTDNAVFKNTTSATLHIVNATADLVSGQYWCEVSNEIGSKEKSPSVYLDVSK